MVEVIGDGFAFTEAPRWHDGALWFSDFYQHRVVRWAGDRFETVFGVPGQPSGLGFSPEGDLMVVSMTDRRLLRGRSGRLETVADLTEHCPGLANDMWVDAAGRAYVGNDGQLDPLEPTVLLRVDPGGAVEIVADGVFTPNGIVMTPDGRQLVVAESFGGRVSVWDVRSGGTLANRRVWASFGPPRRFRSVVEARRHSLVIPDGITLNAAGDLWVADAAGSGVWCVSDGGRIVDHVDTGPYTAYSAVLGGEDGKSLFITAGPALDDVRRDGTKQSAVLVSRVDVPAASY